MTIGLIIAVVVFALLNIVSFRLGIAYRQKIAEAEIGSAEGKAKSSLKDTIFSKANTTTAIISPIVI